MRMPVCSIAVTKLGTQQNIILIVYHDDDVSIGSITLTPVSSGDEDSLSGQLPNVRDLVHRHNSDRNPHPNVKTIIKPNIHKKMTQSREDTARNSIAQTRRELQSTLRVICFLYSEGSDEVLSEPVINQFFSKSVNVLALPSAVDTLCKQLSTRLCIAHMSGFTHCADVLLNHFQSICSLMQSDPHCPILKKTFLSNLLKKQQNFDGAEDLIDKKQVPSNRASMISHLMQDGQMSNRIVEFISECRFGQVIRDHAWNKLHQYGRFPLAFLGIVLDFVDCMHYSHAFSRVIIGSDKSQRNQHELRELCVPDSMRQLIKNLYRYNKGVMYKGLLEPYLKKNNAVINHPTSFRDEWKVMISITDLISDPNKQYQIWQSFCVIALMFEVTAPLIPTVLGRNLYWNYHSMGGGLASLVKFIDRFVYVFCYDIAKQIDHEAPHGIVTGNMDDLLQIWADKAVACMFFSLANLKINGDSICDASLYPWMAKHIHMKPHSAGLKQFSEFHFSRSLRNILCPDASNRKFEVYQEESFTQNMLACTNNWHRIQDDNDTMRRLGIMEQNLNQLVNTWDAIGGMFTTAEDRVRQSAKFWKSVSIKSKRYYKATHKRVEKQQYIQNGKYYGRGNIVSHGSMLDMMNSDLFKYAIPVFDRYDINHHGTGFHATKKYGDPLLYGFTDSDDSSDIPEDDDSIDINDSDDASNPEVEGILSSANNDIKDDNDNETDLKMNILDEVTTAGDGISVQDDDLDEYDMHNMGQNNNNSNSKNLSQIFQQNLNLNTKTPANTQKKQCQKQIKTKQKKYKNNNSKNNRMTSKTTSKKMQTAMVKTRKKSIKHGNKPIKTKKKRKFRNLPKNSNNSNDDNLSHWMNNWYQGDTFNNNKFKNELPAGGFGMSQNRASSKSYLSSSLLTNTQVYPPTKKMKFTNKKRLPKRRPDLN